MAMQPLSRVEQVAIHLRTELQRGRWAGHMPGVFKLESELGINHGILHRALGMLEHEGVLESQGKGRRRLIVRQADKVTKLRIRILLYEKSDYTIHYLVELVHLLQQAGHDAGFADKVICDLRMNVNRIARFVESRKADAWVVAAGSKELLEWFATQPKPAFALFGRLMHVPLASTSPKRAGVYVELVEKLVGLGHRRIVHLSREERRKPTPGFLERLFLDELEKHGILTGAYNLPDWKETAEGLRSLLDSLFRHSPPTAMVIDGAAMFSATRNHLARRGILAPEHVSLVCCDPDPVFDWDIPAVTHMTWDHQPLIRRVVKWADNISRGKADHRKSSVPARLVLGGTIGPVPKYGLRKL